MTTGVPILFFFKGVGKPIQESPIPPADVRFYTSSESDLMVNSPGVVTSPEQQGEARLSLNTQTAECKWIKIWFYS